MKINKVLFSIIIFILLINISCVCEEMTVLYNRNTGEPILLSSMQINSHITSYAMGDESITVYHKTNGSEKKILASELEKIDSNYTTIKPAPIIPPVKKSNKKRVALTFDDGPYSPVTNRILNTLKIYNSKATFFVVGNRVPTYKDTLLRIAQDGHEIGNHTFNHANLSKCDSDSVFTQLNDTQQVVYNISNQIPKYMRAPYGEFNKNVYEPLGLEKIGWSLDTMDWSTKDTNRIVNNVLNNIKSGDVILMHDLYVSTAEAVEILVPKLVDMGYELVTVSELKSNN